MCQRSKYLSNPITVSGGAPVARSAVRDRDAKRFSGVSNLGELGILTQACKHAHASIGDNKLENPVQRSIRNETGLGSPAVMDDIVLQLSKCAHQTGDKALCEPGRYGSVFGMAGPLLPIAVVPIQVELRQWKNSSYVARVATADFTVGQATQHLIEERSRDCN
ncbi:MAG: hypothetical protein ABL973_18285 [Micropepsaceae bacterium]